MNNFKFQIHDTQIINCLESSIMNKKLMFVLEKINMQQNSTLPCKESQSIINVSQQSSRISNTEVLILIDQNRTSLAKNLNLYKKKKKSCFGSSKGKCLVPTKYIFLKPHLFFMDSQELRKELLSHKTTISSYLHYSFSQDNMNLNLNINKIIQHEFFCKNFFTFRKDPNLKESKHVYLILDGCYSTESKIKNSFAQRLFEENSQFCLMEFVWQDFLKNKSYIVTPKVNESFKKHALCKKHYFNCLGRFNQKT